MAATYRADVGIRQRVQQLTARYRQADAVERRLVTASLACIARWGVGKTSLDDIAREAGVSRATVYRAVPGGKDRLLEVVLDHEAGRFFHELDAELGAARDLADLLARGVTKTLAAVTDHPALQTMVELEPELVLPHLAFHRLDRVLAVGTELLRPHLARYLPGEEIPATAEWVTRIVVTYVINPTSAVDPHDPDSISQLVRTYVVPALEPSEPTEPTQPTTPRQEQR
jgi:AcrR family transcriptional regulator